MGTNKLSPLPSVIRQVHCPLSVSPSDVIPSFILSIQHGLPLYLCPSNLPYSALYGTWSTDILLHSIITAGSVQRIMLSLLTFFSIAHSQRSPSCVFHTSESHFNQKISTRTGAEQDT